MIQTFHVQMIMIDLQIRFMFINYEQLIVNLICFHKLECACTFTHTYFIKLIYFMDFMYFFHRHIGVTITIYIGSENTLGLLLLFSFLWRYKFENILPVVVYFIDRKDMRFRDDTKWEWIVIENFYIKKRIFRLVVL